MAYMKETSTVPQMSIGDYHFSSGLRLFSRFNAKEKVKDSFGKQEKRIEDKKTNLLE